MIKIIRRAKLNIIRFVLLLFLAFVATEYIDARPGGGSGSRSRSSGKSSGGSKSSGGGSKSSGGGYSGGGSKSSSKSNSGGSRSSSRSSSSSDGSDIDMPPEVALFILLLMSPWLIWHFGRAFVGGIISSISSVGQSIINAWDEPSEKDKARYVSPATTSTTTVAPSDVQRFCADAEEGLLALTAKDLNFSRTLFLDYVQNVYHQYYSRLGEASISGLRPFFITPPVAKHDFTYSEIVINAMHIVAVGQATISGKPFDQINVLLESNFTQTDSKTGKKVRFLSEEEWHFVREMKGLNGEQVLSLVPAKMQALACPACGAGESFHENLQCRACGTTVEPAEMQWAAAKNKLVYEESYETNALVSYEEEVGTTDATIFAPNLGEAKAKFAALHGIENIDNYTKDFNKKVVKPAFFAIYTAWTKRDIQPVRHLISDFLYQTQQFWIDEYKNQKLSNKLDNIDVSKIELAKIEIDKYYESLTVRIFAACKDYTTKDSTGKVVGGRKDRLRYFSEYWTFVRRVGMDRQPKDSLDLSSCPSCSAPLDKIGQAGTCGYCSNKISTGEFSWVLSRITQDEAYA